MNRNNRDDNRSNELAFLPLYIEKNEDYKQRESKIRKVIQHRLKLEFLKKHMDSHGDKRIYSASEIAEIEEKIDNCDQLIVIICDTNQDLLNRYAFYNYRYELNCTAGILTKEEIEKVIGEKNLYSYELEEIISKDKLTKSYKITLTVETIESENKLLSLCKNKFVSTHKKENYQMYYDKILQSDIIERNDNMRYVQLYLNPREKEELITDIVDAIVSWGEYSLDDAFKMVRILYLESNSVNTFYRYLLMQEQLKKRCEEIAISMNYFEFTVKEDKIKQNRVPQQRNPEEITEEMRTYLGNHIYDYIQETYHCDDDMTGRITGVLLESFDYLHLRDIFNERGAELDFLINEIRENLEAMAQEE